MAGHWLAFALGQDFGQVLGAGSQVCQVRRLGSSAASTKQTPARFVEIPDRDAQAVVKRGMQSPGAASRAPGPPSQGKPWGRSQNRLGTPYIGCHSRPGTHARPSGP